MCSHETESAFAMLHLTNKPLDRFWGIGSEPLRVVSLGRLDRGLLNR